MPPRRGNYVAKNALRDRSASRHKARRDEKLTARAGGYSPHCLLPTAHSPMAIFARTRGKWPKG
jgi:hypothetical protein